MTTPKQEVILHGIAASPGVVHGPAMVFIHKEVEVTAYQVPEEDWEREWSRFEQALAKTRHQISDIRAEISEKLGESEASIFDAHLMVLEDKALIDEVAREFEETHSNIEYCFHKVCRRYIEFFKGLEDEYIRERATDIRDVSRRLIGNLMGHEGSAFCQLTDKRVLVTEDMTPSDAAALDKEKVLAMVTELGSSTSHTVIMARSIQVPAVVGIHGISEKVANSEEILVDGYDGIVILNPTEQTLYRYGKIRLAREAVRKVFDESVGKESMTKDGLEFTLYANIESDYELPVLEKVGAQGVGLFRTESLFLKYDRFPGEDEQFEVYKKVAQSVAPNPVIIRTLDIGGDKQLSYDLVEHVEENPFMGFRAIRFCLKHIAIFKEQLRAILRASAFGKVKLMYPMISSEKELEQAAEVLEEVKEELRKEGHAFNEKIKTGSMIEIPSAAYTADLLAKHCDFFSIGTNDLIQYLLAVDRVNDRIAHLYTPNHPAVLRTIQGVIDAARQNEIDVEVCGEMAGDPIYAPLLIGMGANALSATPGALPEIRYIMQRINMFDVRQLASEVMKMNDPEKIFKKLKDFYFGQVGSVLEKGMKDVPAV